MIFAYIVGFPVGNDSFPNGNVVAGDGPNDVGAKYVGERETRASRSNTSRGHNAAFSNCTLCDRFSVASRSDAIVV